MRSTSVSLLPARNASLICCAMSCATATSPYRAGLWPPYRKLRAADRRRGGLAGAGLRVGYQAGGVADAACGAGAR